MPNRLRQPGAPKDVFFAVFVFFDFSPTQKILCLQSGKGGGIDHHPTRKRSDEEFQMLRSFLRIWFPLVESYRSPETSPPKRPASRATQARG